MPLVWLLRSSLRPSCAVGDQTHCLASFLLFAGPYIIAVLGLVVGGAMRAVSNSILKEVKRQREEERRERRASESGGQGGEESGEARREGRNTMPCLDGAL